MPLALAVLAGSPVFAQGIDPGTLDRNQRDTREHYEMLKKEREADPSHLQRPVIEQEPAPAPAVDAGRTLLVNRFEVSDSEFLTAKDISALTEPYLNRELSIADINQLIAEINALYSQKSDVVARAVLPKQKISDGVVKIQLIEARLGEVRIEGNEHTKDSYIDDRIYMDAGEFLSLRQLERDLQKFNRLNDVFLQASLSPGQEYGTSDVVLLAREAQNFNLNVFADNAGRETVGRERLGVFTQVNSLFGVRDRLSLGGTFSDGSTYAWGSYDIPVHHSGTRLAISADVGDIEIVEGTFEPLNVTGDSVNFGVKVTRPILVTSDSDWDASLGYFYKNSKSYFDGVRLVDTDANDIVLSTNYRVFNSESTWLTSHSLISGRSEGVYVQNYSIYLGSVIRLRQFDSGSSLLIRGRVQLSDRDDLPSFNQFVIGGVASVRGYSEGILAGDQGYAISVEYARPVGTLGERTQRRNLFAFVDHGAAFPYRGNFDDDSDPSSVDFLLSAGVGLDLTLWERLSLKVNVAVPLLYRSELDQDDYRFNAIVSWTAK